MMRWSGEGKYRLVNEVCPTRVLDTADTLHYTRVGMDMRQRKSLLDKRCRNSMIALQ